MGWAAGLLFHMVLGHCAQGELDKTLAELHRGQARCAWEEAVREGVEEELEIDEQQWREHKEMDRVVACGRAGRVDVAPAGGVEGYIEWRAELRPPRCART